LTSLQYILDSYFCCQAYKVDGSPNILNAVTTSNPAEAKIISSSPSPSQLPPTTPEFTSLSTESLFIDTDFDYINESDFSKIDFDFDSDYGIESTTESLPLKVSGHTVSGKGLDLASPCMNESQNTVLSTNSDLNNDLFLTIAMGLILLIAITITYLLLLLSIVKLIRFCKASPAQSNHLIES